MIVDYQASGLQSQRCPKKSEELIEMEIVEVLEKLGRMELVELASLFLPSPPVRVWEEEFEVKESEDGDWKNEEKCQPNLVTVHCSVKGV